MNLLTPNQVMKITGIGCRSTLWRAVKAARFPQPLVLGSRSIRWRSDEIEAWIDARPRRSYSAATLLNPEARS